MVRELYQEYRRYGNFKSFVEESSWDDILSSSTDALDNFCLGVVFLAIVFFGIGLLTS